jgi:hypothetical protein
MNNIPAGRYIWNVFFSVYGSAPVMTINQRLVYSSSSLSQGQTSGFTAYSDGVNEVYVTKVNNTDRFSTNTAGVVDVITPNVNVGLSAQFSIASFGTSGGFDNSYYFLTMCRIS